MILRKPYAFLIKYFMLIHILMFILLTYLVFALRPIYLFFSDYLNNNNNMYFENMANKYIPFVLFAVIVLVLALSIGIFFLMRKKEKPVLFYRLIIIYSIVLLIALVYFYFFFKSLTTTNYNNLRIVINRDIIMILYYINFFFVAFAFIRAFGFDIKKFSFDKDRRELKLDDTDSEEYEVDVKLEKEDVVNYLSRQKRELRYYFSENSKFYIIVSIIAFLSLSLYFGYNHFVVNRVFKQNDDVTINNVTYNVKKSVITTLDKYGKPINDENDFLIVYIDIINNSEKITFDEQQFRINVSDKYYYPMIGYCDDFDDLGTCYKDLDMLANSKQDYIMIYKIDKVHAKILFEILKNKNDYQYTQIELDFHNDNKETENYSRGDNFTFNNKIYRVDDYLILDKTSYVYDSCINGKCTKYTKIVKPNLGDRLMAIKMSSLEDLTDEFLNNCVGLIYRNKNLYGSDIEYIDKYQNIIYFGIPSLVHEEDRLALTFNTRNKIYSILLKEGVNE